MSRARDISIMLSKTEADNTSNLGLLNTSSETSGGGGLAVYTSLDSLPSTGLTSGDQAWVESSSRLYITNGSGWYNVALINASPTLTLNQSGTIQLNTDTLSVTVIASASDSDDNQDIISFSVESDGNMVGTGTTVSQDSSVFTITALSADSGGTAGDFTLTFKATDQIAVDNETLSFSLTFTNIIDSSAETVLLMKAAGNSATNAAITYQDSSDASAGFTEGGNPEATTFTPYRSGGYSTYFGGATDRIYTGSSADFDLDTNDWCYEGFFYVPEGHSFTSYPRLMGLGPYYNNPNSFGVMPRDADQSDYITAYWGDGGSNASRKLISSTTWDKGQWNHVAVVRKGGAIALYYNGTRIANNASYGASTDIGNGNTYAYIGHTGNLTEGTNMYFRDVRLVNGSSIYDPANTTITVPTEALTAVTNTKLLVGATPYIADISSSAHALTLSGVDGTQPFSPYDYEPWTADDHAGSVYFDGTGDYVTGPSVTTGTTWTVEAWVYPERYYSGSGHYDRIWAIGSTLGDSLVLNIQNTGSVVYRVNDTIKITSSSNISLNTWTHVALVCDGSSTTLYFNGSSVGTVAETSSKTSKTLKLSTLDNTQGYMKGNIADLRLVFGTAVYTSSFTPPTAPLSHITNTDLLMNNKSDANIYDASASGIFTVGNDAQSSTSSRKFSTSSSVFFDGTGDFLNIDNYTDLFQFGTGDFTIEGWYKADTTSSDHYIISFSGGTFSASTTHFGINIYQGNWRAGGFDDKLVGGVGSGVNTGIDTTTWHHFALVHASQNLKYYIDGTQIGSTVSTTGDTFNCGSTACIGGYHSSNASLNWDGYLQDIRITKGYARYTANFTAPTAEFEL